MQDRKGGKMEMSYQPSEASKEKLLETERFEKIDSIVNHILEEIERQKLSIRDAKLIPIKLNEAINRSVNQTSFAKK